jgi:hypothetical protein
VPSILDAIEEVCRAYEPSQPSDILVTKIILGTIGCLPACDRYFKAGFKEKGFKYSRIKGQPSEQFIKHVFCFCRDHLSNLRDVQKTINKKDGMYYPLMKLVDMYFYEIGYELEIQKKG